jgi:phage N-6-adenine-methyltransferase
VSRANKDKLGYVGSKPGSKRDSDAWFTPPDVVDRVRTCLGAINLDPFSSEHANKTVRSENYLTEKDDALVCNWGEYGNNLSVFMNPPYSQGLCEKACRRFLSFLEEGVVGSGVVLTNNATETRWYQALARECSGICLPAGRISFWNADGKAISGNTRGQTLFYFGACYPRFHSAFKEMGVCFEKRVASK